MNKKYYTTDIIQIEFIEVYLDLFEDKLLL